MDMKKIIYIIILFLFIGVVYAERIEVSLASCVDGDTARLIIDGKEKKFRFIGVNAPDIEHEDSKAEYMGEDSYKFTCSMLENAKKIEVEYDNNSKKTDKYDRHLAWIWVDGELLQELLVSKGLAKVDYVYDEYKYISKLCNVEIEAYNNKIGIWKKNKKMGYCYSHKYEEKTYEEIEKEVEEDEEIDKYLIIIFLVIIIIVILAIITVVTLKKN